MPSVSVFFRNANNSPLTITAVVNVLSPLRTKFNQSCIIEQLTSNYPSSNAAPNSFFYIDEYFKNI